MKNVSALNKTFLSAILASGLTACTDPTEGYFTRNPGEVLSVAGATSGCVNPDESPVEGLEIPKSYQVNGQLACADGSTDMRVETEVTEYNETGFEMKMTVTNHSNDSVENWDLAFQFPYQVEVTGDAELNAQGGGMVNASSDESLEPGDTAVVTVAGSAEPQATLPVESEEREIASDDTVCYNPEQSPVDWFTMPSEFRFNGQTACNDGSTEVRIETNVNQLTQYWFTVQLIITNHSQTALHNWDLEFEFPYEVRDMWSGGRLVSQEETLVQAAPNAWNAPILPGRSAVLVFNGNPADAVEGTPAPAAPEEEVASTPAPKAAPIAEASKPADKKTVNKAKKVAKIHKLKRKIANLKKQLQRKLSNKNAKIRKLKKRIGKVQAELRRELAKKDRKIRKLKNRIGKLQAELRRELSKKDRKIRKLKNRIGKVRSELRRELAKKDRKIRKLKNQIRKARSKKNFRRVSHLRAKIQKIRAKKGQLRAQYQQKVQNIRGKIKNVRAKKQQLKKHYHGKVQNIRGKIQNVRAKKQALKKQTQAKIKNIRARIQMIRAA